MGDVTQDYGKYGAEKSKNIECEGPCRETKPHTYRALLTPISDDPGNKPFSFLYSCVTCSTPQTIEPTPSQLELILKATQGKNGSF